MHWLLGPWSEFANGCLSASFASRGCRSSPFHFPASAATTSSAIKHSYYSNLPARAGYQPFAVIDSKHHFPLREAESCGSGSCSSLGAEDVDLGCFIAAATATDFVFDCDFCHQAVVGPVDFGLMQCFSY